LGVLFLIIAVLAVLVVGYLYRRLSSERVAFDPETLCPLDGPKSLTVVLIDTTDPLDGVQKEDVKKRLEDIKDTMPKWGELQLFTVGSSGSRMLQPELTVCNPGRGSEINPLYGNPALIEKRWRTKFAAQVDRVLSTLLEAQSATMSPIAESIQQVAVQSFEDRRVKAIHRQLVIVSDMIQHTPGLSQYRGIESFEDFRTSPYYLQVRTNLPNTDVVILYLRRPQTVRLQGRRHIEFWQNYFADAGATVSDVVSIQG